jgi:hypothetical protein
MQKDHVRALERRASYWTHGALSSLIYASCFPKIDFDFRADAVGRAQTLFLTTCRRPRGLVYRVRPVF